MPATRGVKAAINALTNFLGYAVAIGLGVVSYPFILGEVGLDVVGVYALIMAIVAPLDVANLGFSEATIKYVAQYNQLRDFEKVTQYLSTTLFMNLIIGIAGMIIITFLGPSLAYRFFDFSSQPYETIQACFALAGVGWLVRQVTSFFLSIPIAFLKFKVVAVGNLVTSVLTTGSIILGVAFKNNLIGYTCGTLLGSIISLIFWWFLILIVFKSVSFSIKPYKEVWRSSFTYGGWQTIGSIASIMTNQVDKYLLGAYLPTSSSGVYNVILQIQQKILSTVHKIGEVLFPTFSASSGYEHDSNFNALLKATYVMALIGILIFVPMLPFSFATLRLWIDEDFAMRGSGVMKCLFLVGALGVVTVPSIFFLRAYNQVKASTLLTYITGIATALASFFFIREYGLIGAGYGVLMALVIRTLAVQIIIRRYFSTNYNWQSFTSVIWVPIMVSLAIAGLIDFYDLFNPQGWFALAFEYCIVACLVLTSIILFNFAFPSGAAQNIAMFNLIKQLILVFLKKKAIENNV